MKKRKKKSFRKINTILKICIGTLSVLLIGLLVCIFLNKQVVEITIAGDNPAVIEAGSAYQEEGASAIIRGTIFRFLSSDLEVENSGTVDPMKPGTYTISYTASRNDHTATAERTVIVQDTTAPVITLTEDADAYTLPGHTFEEIGFKAEDIVDGDLTASVNSEEQDGKVFYTVTDSAGNTGQAVRTIVYDDRKEPEIILDGGEDITWYANDGTWTDSYSAEDDLDGDVTSGVTVEGSVDSSTTGDYTLTYTVQDTYGNTAQAVRTVHVRVRPVNDSAGSEDAMTIYLTFDDGPGQYTDELLSILAKYNVKATFFTTSSYPGYAYCMAEEAAAGHTVAVHSATHSYSWIYSSTDAYWEDFNEQNALICSETGSYTTLFRFPGGSSNTVSMNYCSGIMSTLASQAAEKGYEYFDWNVSSGDAGETTSSSQVYQNVISGIAANSAYGVPSVVLQHDIKGFSVAAVEDIIQWGLENGYSFKALSSGSYHARHSIAN